MLCRHEGDRLDTTLWVILGIAGAVVALYLITMRVLYKQSRDTERRIEYTKVREWKDED